jgi:hypothetical protein
LSVALADEPLLDEDEVLVVGERAVPATAVSAMIATAAMAGCSARRLSAGRVRRTPR